MRTRRSAPYPLPTLVTSAQVRDAQRLTMDLVARSARLWMDLWFANLDRASGAFWHDVRQQSQRR